MDSQIQIASRNDIWRLENEMKNVYATQAEHADRLMRLERRNEDDGRLKSVWGSQSPFPATVNGTPQQGINLQSLYVYLRLTKPSQSKATILQQKPSKILIRINRATYLEAYIWILKMNRDEALQELIVFDSMRVRFTATLGTTPVHQRTSFLSEQEAD